MLESSQTTRRPWPTFAIWVAPDANHAMLWPKLIWQWAQKCNIWLTVAHIPGKPNTIADKRSRHFHDHLEWELNPTIFHVIFIYQQAHITRMQPCDWFVTCCCWYLHNTSHELLIVMFYAFFNKWLLVIYHKWCRYLRLFILYLKRFLQVYIMRGTSALSKQIMGTNLECDDVIKKSYIIRVRVRYRS